MTGKPCGMSANGQRCWEYLSHRLQEINQLRSEDDEQEPILVSKLNCLQVRHSLQHVTASIEAPTQCSLQRCSCCFLVKSVSHAWRVLVREFWLPRAIMAMC